MKSYIFHPTVIARTPRLPFTPENLTTAQLRLLLDETWFLEAIFLASPELYRMSISWREGIILENRKKTKLLASLTKYYTRMMSRSTPFGLFAGCMALHWGDAESIELHSGDFNRITRLDMHFLCALALSLGQHPIVKKHLTYSPNTSIYTIGDEIRYVEYQYTDGKRMHQISAVSHNDYIQSVIDKAHSGAGYRELTESLITEGISEKEAACFIDELISCQLLVSDLEPAITGGNFIDQIISVVEKVIEQSRDEELKRIITGLNQIRNAMGKLDCHRVNDIEAYQTIIQDIKALGISYDSNKLFQTDFFQNATGQILTNRWQQEIEKAITVLNRFTVSERPKSMLQRFVDRFYARYESREIPLLEALDTEIGIGYSDNAQVSMLMPLVEDIHLPGNEKKMPAASSDFQDWLFQKLQKSADRNPYTVTIEENDLEEFPEANWKDTPPSFSVMFRLVEDENLQRRLLIESAGGAGAIPLLGRFAHGQAQLLETVIEIAATEQEKNPEVIFAEIIHLPESRTGNVLMHPAFRDYEIPFLARASLPVENQIPLQDLYISVQHNRMILRSKRLNKVVVPRLSNAHNYNYNALPIYQFLCDLQHQYNPAGLGLDCSALGMKYKFSPRICYQNTILKPATWWLTKDEVEQVLEGRKLMHIACFTERLTVLVDGDNELLIDWQNPLSVSAFRDAIKNHGRVMLKEFLYEPKQPVIREVNTSKGYTNQFIALLIKKESSYNSVIGRDYYPKPIQRAFSIGSEWLYFKLYGGIKTADRLLIEYIKPLCLEMQAKALLSEWFFIRYEDPDPHLRLRFHLNDRTRIGEVIMLVYRYMQPAIEAKYLWKIQTDTYQRELERYGSGTIENAETIFYYDSERILAFLDQTEGDTREEIRWLWGMGYIDRFLDTFNLELQSKRALLKMMKESFAREFQMGIELKQQLDKKYRQHRNSIQHMLDSTYGDEKNPFYLLKKIINSDSRKISVIADKLLEDDFEIPLFDLLSSYIHMFINRLIPSQQRLHELLIYDFLFRCYASRLAQFNHTDKLLGQLEKNIKINEY